MTTTVTRAIALREEHPDWTLQRIATEIGVSRQRVHQVLDRGRLTTGGVPEPVKAECDSCKRPMDVGVHERRGYCKDCWREAAMVGVICQECFNARGLYRIVRMCHLNILNGRIQSNGKRAEIAFCSQRCLGAWRGRTHGFAAHPENSLFGLEAIKRARTGGTA